MWCEVSEALGLTTARADHRCIFRVGAKGTSAAATIQAGLSSIAGPHSIPLPTWSLAKGSTPYCQYGMSIPQLTTDHLCFCNVPGVVTDSLPLTTTVHFHTAFVLCSAINKTNIRVAYTVCREQRAQLNTKIQFQMHCGSMSCTIAFELDTCSVGLNVSVDIRRSTTQVWAHQYWSGLVSYCSI